MHIPLVRTKRLILLTSVALLAFHSSAAADTVRFNLQAAVTAGPEAASAVEGTLTARRTRAEADTPRSVPVRVPGPANVELAPGHYLVNLQAPGWWMAPKLVEVRGSTVIDLPVRQTGTVEGTVAPSVQDSAPSRLLVRFENPEASISSEARCTAESTSFRCEVPEGKLDLRIAIPAHVPHYRWSVPVDAGKSLDLGSFRFVPGASLSGRLAVEEGALRGVRLSLARVHEKETTLSITPGENGFFSIGPVLPGHYNLSAAQKGLISAPRIVEIREGLEAQLREPLLLAKPRRVDVTLSPAATPTGGRWGVTLARIVEGSKPVVAAQELASADGSWSADHLVPGDYELAVSPQGGPVWYSEVVSVSAAVTSRHVAVKGVRFQGEVRLGDEPLAAQLIFGGDHGSHSIPWRSDERGEFKGYLPTPPEGNWIVTVKSEKPRVHTTLTDVVPTIDLSSGEATIEIILPATTIEGQVVDEKGDTVPHASINISPSRADLTIVQVDSDEKGSFDVRGLTLGTYTISATRFLKESDPVEVVLRKADTGPASVRLVLKPYRKWSGRVTAPDGRPVPDARIYAIAVDIPIVMALPGRTDGDGRFAVLVPAAARLFDVSVAPKGFAFSYFRGELTESLNLVVDRRGGTFVIDAPNDRTLVPRIWHNGAMKTPFGLGWVAQFEDSPPERQRIRIPQMEPGEYTICLMPSEGVDYRTAKPAGDCKAIYLAPFAEEFVAFRSASGGAGH